jgi:hypothetical protein
VRPSAAGHNIADIRGNWGNDVDLLAWLIYLAPTALAWYRQREGQPIVGTLGMIAFINVVLGWTGVGWLLALANALGYNPVAQIAPKIAKFYSTGAPPGSPPNFGQGAPPGQGGPTAPGQVTCGQCGGGGTMTCSTCGGRGNWYEQPQLATGSAEHKSCGACIGSGRIRCQYCGGSGRITV